MNCLSLLSSSQFYIKFVNFEENVHPLLLGLKLNYYYYYFGLQNHLVIFTERKGEDKNKVKTSILNNNNGNVFVTFNLPLNLTFFPLSLGLIISIVIIVIVFCLFDLFILFIF